MPITETHRQVMRERLQMWTRTQIEWDGFGIGEGDPPDNTPFIRPTPIDAVTTQESFRGSGRSGLTKISGFLETQLFFPRGWLGGLNTDRTVDEYKALWRNYQTDNIWFHEPESRVIVHEDEGKYIQYNVTAPYTILDRAPKSLQEGIERMIFTQSNHGLSAFDAIRRSSTGWLTAQGGSTGTLADSIVAAVSGDQFVAVQSGFIQDIAHGFAIGSDVWLSTATAGLLTTAEPTASPKYRCGKGVDTDTFLVLFERITTS